MIIIYFLFNLKSIRIYSLFIVLIKLDHILFFILILTFFTTIISLNIRRLIKFRITIYAIIVWQFLYGEMFFKR